MYVWVGDRSRRKEQNFPRESVGKWRARLLRRRRLHLPYGFQLVPRCTPWMLLLGKPFMSWGAQTGCGCRDEKPRASREPLHLLLYKSWADTAISVSLSSFMPHDAVTHSKDYINIKFITSKGILSFRLHFPGCHGTTSP